MRNTAWLLFEQIFRMGLALIVTSLVARYLGTEKFGLINYGLAFVMIFTAASKLGIDSIIVNEIIKKREDTGKLIGTTIYLRFFSSIISIFLVVIIIKFLNPGNLTTQIIVIIQSISLLFLVFDTIGYWFQSNLQSKYLVIAKSVAFTIISGWRLALIFFEKPLVYFAVATTIEAIAISVLILLFYIKFNGPKLAFSLNIAKKLLSKSYHFLIAAVLLTVYTQLDKILLGQMTSVTTVGIYTAALAISSLWVFVPNSLIESSRPVIMATKDISETLYIRKLKRLFCSIIWISIGAAIIITLLSKPIILIIYGNQFTESIAVLTILIWARLFALMGSARAIWLTVENLGKFQVIFVGIGAILNVVLNVILIPKLGAVGAAISALTAEIFATFLAVLLFKETRPLFKLIIQSFLLIGLKNK